jgi:phenylacetate-CoA ligase
MTQSQAMRERADAILSNRTFIPVFELADEKLPDMVRTIRDVGPVLLDGYAEALDLLAHYIKSSGASLGVRPSGIMSSAQTLPASSRAVMEEAFGCKIFDKYGAREFSGIAYECEAHEGHHVVAEGYIVETLRDGQPAKPGEVGEIVITDLNNYCMPFIRYRIGDLAEALPEALCRCGRGAPRIGAIEGRVQSIIQGTDGRYLPGTFFAHYLKEFDHAVRRYQVIQEQAGAIRFCVVKGGRYSQDVLEEFLTTFRAHLGERMRIDVEFVDDVALVRTGKRLASVSRIPVDFQNAAPPVARSRAENSRAAETPDTSG